MNARWMDREIDRARSLLDGIESCQDPAAMKPLLNKLRHSLDLVQSGGWELSSRLQEARLSALHKGRIQPDIAPKAGPGLNGEAPVRTVMAEKAGGMGLGGWRVLLADDDKPIRDLLSIKLGKLGCQLTCASDGEEAWNIFANNPKKFDLVLTDQQMPRLSGTGLAGRIRALGADVPIVLLTGGKHLAGEESELRKRFSLVISKPVSLAVLQMSLVDLLLRESSDA